MNAFEHGNAGRFVAFLLSGLLCGIMWETWNFWAIAKWVYTVPYFEDLKVYEMPILGYLGFPVFSLEVFAFVSFIKGLKKKGVIQASSVLISLIFSLFVFQGVDRHTVFSYTTKVEEMDFLKDKTKEHLLNVGILTSYGIDLKALDESERQAILLLHLNGLGLKNYLKLKQHGIDTIEHLASLDEERLSQILNEANRRRIRVYIRAAKKYKTIHSQKEVG